MEFTRVTKFYKSLQNLHFDLVQILDRHNLENSSFINSKFENHAAKFQYSCSINTTSDLGGNGARPTINLEVDIEKNRVEFKENKGGGFKSRKINNRGAKGVNREENGRLVQEK